MPKHKQVIITSAAFEGTDELTWQDLENLRVADMQAAITSLIDDWDGSPKGLISVQLANDRRNIAGSAFNLMGSIFDDDPKVISTDKLFTGSKAKLYLNTLNFENFEFKDSLTSALVDSSELDFEFRHPGKNGKELTSEEATEKGLSGFSCRIHVFPTQEDYVNVALIAFPRPAAKLLEENPAANNSSFPGIELCVIGQVELIPCQSIFLGEKSWGQPFVPIILSDEPFTASSERPSTETLRATTTALLRTGSKPTTSPNWEYLKEKWASILASGEDSLQPRTPPFIWPAARSLDPQQGKHRTSPPHPPFLLL